MQAIVKGYRIVAVMVLVGGLVAISGCDKRSGGGGSTSSSSKQGYASHYQGVMSVTSANFDGTVAKGVTLVDFWAPWCGPCRRQGPILEQLAKQVGNKATIVKVNVDEEKGLAQRFGIRGIPALFVFKDGKIVKKMTGVQSAGTLLQAISDAS